MENTFTTKNILHFDFLHAGGSSWSKFGQGLLRKCLQRYMLFPFLKKFCLSFQVHGLDNLSDLNGPCLFVSNHSSHADVAIILAALPAKLRSNLAIAAAADYFYKSPLIGSLVTLVLNTFPFERSHPKMGLLKGRQVLQSGQSLLIFPEGTRTKPGEHHNFKRGFAALACKQGLPVVPIRIEGAYEMLPKGAKWPSPAAVRIYFGKPVYPSGESSSDLAHEVEERVQRLSLVA